MNLRVYLTLGALLCAVTLALRVPVCLQSTKRGSALFLRSPVRLPNSKRSPMLEKMKTAAAKSTVVEKMRANERLSPLFPSAEVLYRPIDQPLERELSWSDRVEMLPYMATFLLFASASALWHSALPIEGWGSIELVFFTYVQALVSFNLGRPAPLDKTFAFDRDWDEMWNNVFDTVDDRMRSGAGCRAWFHSWFLEGDFEDITREDAREFMAWAMFSSILEYLKEDELQALDQAIVLVEQRCGNHIFPTRPVSGGKSVTSMRSTIEPLQWIHKPLTFYLITQGVFGYSLSQQLKGYNVYESYNMRHWVCASVYEEKVATTKTSSSSSSSSSTSSDEERVFASTGSKKSSDAAASSTHKATPIVFYHGVGGLVCYSPFIKALEALGIPVMAVEMPYVSLHIAPHVPSIQDHVASFEELLDTYGYSHAIVIGHSWGSNVVSWLTQMAPHRIRGAVFLDPVVFMLHLRDITFNWFYETRYKVSDPNAKDPLVSAASIVSLVKTEVFSNHALQRPYVWFRNILFPQEMQSKPFRTAVVVSGKDPIVPSSAILEQITGYRAECSERGEESKIEVYNLPEAGHGGFVFEEPFRQEVVQTIHEMYVKVEKERVMGM